MRANPFDIQSFYGKNIEAEKKSGKIEAMWGWQRQRLGPGERLSHVSTGLFLAACKTCGKEREIRKGLDGEIYEVKPKKIN